MRLIQPKVTLEWFTPAPLSHIERAGRTSYKSEDLITPESGPIFVEKLNRLGHHSVLEHAVASLRFITDRGVSHEIVRHRIASYTQESTRYVNYNKGKHGAGDIQFILPEYLTEAQKVIFLDAFATAQYHYNTAIEAGCTPQQARDILPTGVKTELVMTCNFREWLHFLTLRTDKAAHPKMQTVAKMAGKLLSECCPEVFGKYA